MRKNKFRIASLGTGNASAYDAAGNRYFLPARFRQTAKVGDYVLVIENSFDKSTERDATGQIVLNADGTPKLIDKPFKRWDVTFVGSLQEMAEASAEDKILDATIDHIVAKSIEDTIASLQTKHTDTKSLVNSAV